MNQFNDTLQSVYLYRVALFSHDMRPGRCDKASLRTAFHLSHHATTQACSRRVLPFNCVSILPTIPSCSTQSLTGVRTPLRGFRSTTSLSYWCACGEVAAFASRGGAWHEVGLRSARGVVSALWSAGGIVPIQRGARSVLVRSSLPLSQQPPHR